MKNWACNLGVTVRSSRTSYLSLFGVVSCRTFLISHFPDFSMFQNTSQHRIVEFTRKNCLLIISRQAYAFRSVDIQHFLKKFNKKISFGHCPNLTKTEWSLLCWISSNIFVENQQKVLRELSSRWFGMHWRGAVGSALFLSLSVSRISLELREVEEGFLDCTSSYSDIVGGGD